MQQDGVNAAVVSSHLTALETHLGGAVDSANKGKWQRGKSAA